MQPIYTAENTNPAYQLNWSVALFGKIAFPPQSDWLDELKLAVESDGVRILEFRFVQPNVGQFLVSTQPSKSPSEIIRSLKGRWQYVIRSQHLSAFRRNYYIGSVGDANCRVLDQYIAVQPAKHRMADPSVQQRLETLQFHDPAIDLGELLTGNYGRFLYALQIVVENADNWNEIQESVLAESRDMICRAAAKKSWRLSRVGLLSNHIHVLLGAAVTETPASIALSLMNNLAFVQGMKPVLRFSYYVGTFGHYDWGAVRLMLR